jgi:hypothetical protein
MALESPSPGALAARLIAHAQENGRATGTVGALETAFHLISGELSRSMGAGGCRALLSQALRKARAGRPALTGVDVVAGPHARLDGLKESVEVHGAKQVAAGLEATLVALFELLSRLIGDELSTTLAEMSMTNDERGAAQPDPDRAPGS